MPAPKPDTRLVPADVEVRSPKPVAAVKGYARTFDRRGSRALVRHDAGWCGRFLVEVDGTASRILASIGISATARYVDDERVIVSDPDRLWVGRRGPQGLAPVAGVEKVSGDITTLPRDMIAIETTSSALQLLCLRRDALRVFKGRIKAPDDLDRTLVVEGERVLSTTFDGDETFELLDWDLGAGWDPDADVDQAVAKLVKKSSLSITAGPPRAAPTADEGVVIMGDGSRWRLHDDAVSIAHGDGWCTATLPGPLAGEHYVELPPRERDFLVGALVHGGVDHERGVAWLLTGDRKLVRVSLSDGRVAAAGGIGQGLAYSSAQTLGVFPLPDGRVVVIGNGELVVADPKGKVEPQVTHLGRERYVSGCASAVRVDGQLIAHVGIRASSTKNGLPGCWLAFDEIAGRVRRWQDVELPMYAPRLEMDGTTLYVSDHQRALAFDLSEALPWYRTKWSGRDDQPPLPPRAASAPKGNKKTKKA